MPPFDSKSAASVGLFSFSATVKEGEIEISFLDGECIEYDNPWETEQSDYRIITQCCAIAAPATGFLAWFQLIVEMIFCRLRCSSLLIPLLLLVASGLQGCSFMIFADREFGNLMSSLIVIQDLSSRIATLTYFPFSHCLVSTQRHRINANWTLVHGFPWLRACPTSFLPFYARLLIPTIEYTVFLLCRDEGLSAAK